MNPRISSNGTKQWYNEHDQLHRTDGPAIIYPNGTQYWYINGTPHRLDGPAIESQDGTQYWYIHGNQLTEAEYYDIIQSEEHLNWYLLQL